MSQADNLNAAIKAAGASVPAYYPALFAKVTAQTRTTQEHIGQEEGQLVRLYFCDVRSTLHSLIAFHLAVILWYVVTVIPLSFHS